MPRRGRPGAERLAPTGFWPAPGAQGPPWVPVGGDHGLLRGHGEVARRPWALSGGPREGAGEDSEPLAIEGRRRQRGRFPGRCWKRRGRGSRSKRQSSTRSVVPRGSAVAPPSRGALLGRDRSHGPSRCTRSRRRASPCLGPTRSGSSATARAAFMSKMSTGALCRAICSSCSRVTGGNPQVVPGHFIAQCDPSLRTATPAPSAASSGTTRVATCPSARTAHDRPCGRRGSDERPASPCRAGHNSPPFPSLVNNNMTGDGRSVLNHDDKFRQDDGRVARPSGSRGRQGPRARVEA